MIINIEMKCQPESNPKLTIKSYTHLINRSSSKTEREYLHTLLRNKSNDREEPKLVISSCVTGRLSDRQGREPLV